MVFPAASVSSQRYRPNPEIKAEKVGEQLLLFHLVSGQTFRLNPTGRLVWELASANHRCDEIAGRLQHSFNISAATALADAKTFLGELVQNRLLELTPPSAP